MSAAPATRVSLPGTVELLHAHRMCPGQSGTRLTGIGSELSPAKLPKIDPAAARDPHTFLPEADALQAIPAGRPPTDLSLRVHHSVPWDVVPAGPERPPHRARGPGIPQSARDLPIGGDPPRRDPAHQGVDAGEERSWECCAGQAQRGECESVAPSDQRWMRVQPRLILIVIFFLIVVPSLIVVLALIAIPL